MKKIIYLLIASFWLLAASLYAQSEIILKGGEPFIGITYAGKIMFGYDSTGGGKYYAVKVDTNGYVGITGIITSITNPVAVTQSGTWNITAVDTINKPVSAKQSGTWDITSITNPVAATQSGTWDITSITNPVAATQSGTWDIGTVTTLTGITNPVAATQSGTWDITSITNPVAATQSGTWDIGTVTTLTEITNTVNVDGSGVTQPISAAELNYLVSADTYGAANAATVTTETDTIIFTGTVYWAKYTVTAIDDSLEFSLDGSFTDADRLLPGQSFTTPDKFNPVTFPKLYIRRKGAVGTVTYDYSWLGY